MNSIVVKKKMCYIIKMQNSSIFTSSLRILHTAAVYVAEYYMIPFDRKSGQYET